MKRKARTPIKDGEWIVSIQLQVDDQNVGEPFELRYSDSYLAKCPENVSTLVGGRIDEAAARLKPKKKGKK